MAETADIHGLKMYYEIHGQGRPLILLHGGLNTIQTSFAKQLPVFAQNHRVIAIEQMGHGHTADVPSREFSYEGMADDTAALLVHLGIRGADVVGWSDGGQIALRLAVTHPELLRRVVVSGVGLGASPASRKQLATADIANWFPEARAEYARVSPDGAAHWAVCAEKGRAMWSKPSWGFSEEDLTKISLPVLVINGDHGDTSLEELARVVHAIPKSRLCVLPGTGHATFQTRAEWLNPMILDFLDGN
jgi:pimeloyl-ACP methyl ester carboxylesterase